MGRRDSGDGFRSDSELVELVKHGDRAAFDELDERHRGHVYAQCLSIMHDDEKAKDCVQDAFVNAYLALPRFREDAQFSTWLYVIARNVCLMHLRKKRLVTISLDRPVECPQGTVEREVVDPSADASASVLREELRAALAEQVRMLNPSNRDVFELRVVQGLSTRSTAVALGISDAAVKSRLHRACTSLRQALSLSSSLRSAYGESTSNSVAPRTPTSFSSASAM